MDDAKAGAGPESTRNLAALLAMLVFGACLWWWFAFSGPFRWLIDLELRLFGNWWEPSAAIALGLGGIAVVLLLMVAVKWLLPDPSAVVVNLLVCAILVMLTAAALVKARQLWSDAARLPGLGDPVQEVTLAELDGRAPPLGHVRLLGTPRQDRSVTLSLHERARGHTDTYVPLNVDAGGLVRVVATRTEKGIGGDASPIPANPEGVLLSDAIDARTRYQLRREGLPVAEDVFVLFWPGNGVSTDGQIEAILLAAPALLFWPFAGWDAWRRRRAGKAMISPAPVRRRPPPVAPPPVAPAPVAQAPVAPAPGAVPGATDDGWQFLRDASPSGVGMLAGGGLLLALWEGGWVLPGAVEAWSYVAAGLLLVVSFVLEMLPGGRRPPAEPDPVPSADAALLYLMRDSPVSNDLYYRVDVDGVRVTVLKSRRYTVVALRPGPHLMAVNVRYSLAADTVERFEVQAGDVVVYRLHVPLLGRPTPERVLDVAGARASMAGLKKIPPDVGLLPLLP